MQNEIMKELEKQLSQAASHLPYPQTPDIAAQVDWDALARKSRRPGSRRLAWALVVLLVAVFSLLSVPSVRAQLIEFLQIGGVRILLPEPTATVSEKAIEIPASQAPPTATRLVPTQDFVVSVLDLDGLTTLAEARQIVEFPIQWPSYPAALGEPDHVIVSDIGTGTYVVLAWMSPDEPDKVEISLYILGPGVRLTKGEPPVIEETQVNGHPAVFVDGVYVLSVDGFVNPARLVAGPVLVWQEGGLTYRLEADLPRMEMIRMAESIQPQE